MGCSGGRNSKTKTVMRTANTPSENALKRSGVALRSTDILLMLADFAQTNISFRSRDKRFFVHYIWHPGHVAFVVAFQYVDKSLHSAARHAFFGIN